MKNKIVSIICIGIVLVMSMGVLCACGKTEEEKPLVQQGDFLTLQQAFDQGLLTHDDLEIIAYFHHSLKIGDKVFPVPEYPEQLDEATAQIIKESWICYCVDSLNIDDEERKNNIIERWKKNVAIEKYYGTYNGNIAVFIPPEVLLTMIKTDVIDGVEFFYANFNENIMLFVPYSK